MAEKGTNPSERSVLDPVTCDFIYKTLVANHVDKFHKLKKGVECKKTKTSLSVFCILELTRLWFSVGVWSYGLQLEQTNGRGIKDF